MIKNKSFYMVMLIVILIGGLIICGISIKLLSDNLFSLSNNNYKEKIDSLENLIDVNNKKFITLDSLNQVEQEKIFHLQSQLYNLNYKTDQNLRRYEEQINNLNNLNDSQLTTKFTSVFSSR